MFDYLWEGGGHGPHGKGDLVFTNGKGDYAVVEVKALKRHGRRAQGMLMSGEKSWCNRRKLRRRVEEQARRHARVYERLYPTNTVTPMLLTEDGLFIAQGNKWIRHRAPSTKKKQNNS